MSAGEVRTTADLKDGLHALDIVYFGRDLSARNVSIRWMPWEQRKGCFRFGRCWIDTKRIEISRVLAWPWVPEYVVLNTIYHEALHLLYGPEHDDRFKLAERMFTHYAEALVWETSNYDELVAARKPSLRQPA